MKNREGTGGEHRWRVASQGEIDSFEKGICDHSLESEKSGGRTKILGEGVKKDSGDRDRSLRKGKGAKGRSGKGLSQGSLFPADFEVPKINSAINRIFDWWNKQPGVIRHRAITSHVPAIKQALTRFSEPEIKLAIARYGLVVENRQGKYRKAYLWTLNEFLSRRSGYNISRLIADNWQAVWQSFEAETGDQWRDRMLKAVANLKQGQELRGRSEVKPESQTRPRPKFHDGGHRT